MLTPPEIAMRGFADTADTAMMESNVKRVLYETMSYCDKKHIQNPATIKSKIKANLTGYLYKSVRRSPMIATVIHKL